MSTQKKTIVVFGATGAQGGSVVQSLLQIPNSPYEIRAVTRNASSPAALALSAAGVTLATADLNDAASLESALQGAHAVFLVTDFWAPSNLARPEGEFEQGKRALDVLARIPTLEHLIWSSLPSIKNATGGKYTAVIHFDGKAEVTEYLKKEHKALWGKTTELWIAPYYQVWKSHRSVFGPKRVEIEGGEIFILASSAKGEVKLPMVDVRETGTVVAAILEKGGEVKGKTVSMVGDDTNTQLDNLTVWGKHVGKVVQYQQISENQGVEALKGMGLPEYLVKDLSELPAAFQEFEGVVYKGDGIVMANEILPEGKRLGSWKEYVESEDWEEYLKE